MVNGIRRRRLLSCIGAVAATGALAGCSDGGEDGGDGGDGDTVEAPEDVQDYLSDTSNFDGEMVDATGDDEVTVDVGAEGNGGNLAFEPAAVQVSTDTTVTWEWIGEGGIHNVEEEVDDEGERSLYSGDPVDSSTEEYEHTFEESGTYLYYCSPHQPQGMKGAVVVEE